VYVSKLALDMLRRTSISDPVCVVCVCACVCLRACVLVRALARDRHCTHLCACVRALLCELYLYLCIIIIFVCVYLFGRVVGRWVGLGAPSVRESESVLVVWVCTFVCGVCVVCVGVCACGGCAVVWVCGCVGVWVCGCGVECLGGGGELQMLREEDLLDMLKQVPQRDKEGGEGDRPELIRRTVLRVL
jgi:hypothetical protein